VKTGVQGIYNSLKILDSGFRRNDGNPQFQTFYETIIIGIIIQKERRSKIKKWILLVAMIVSFALPSGCASTNKQTDGDKGGSKIQSTADQVGSAIDKTATQAGKGVENAASKTGQVLDTAAKKTGTALERALKKIKGLFEE
jgi:hypothetical protein